MRYFKALRNEKGASLLEILVMMPAAPWR